MKYKYNINILNILYKLTVWIKCNLLIKYNRNGPEKNIWHSYLQIGSRYCVSISRQKKCGYS